MHNFTEKVVLNSDIKTTYLGKELILLNAYLYEGPVTMQLLPYGGIQSVFHYHLIIHTPSGFITCDNVIYDYMLMTVKDFILKNPNLVNVVLPN